MPRAHAPSVGVLSSARPRTESAGLEKFLDCQGKERRADNPADSPRPAPYSLACDELILRCILSTSRHSTPASLAPSTPASSQLLNAGSQLPQRLSALAFSPVDRSDRKRMGKARRAGRCMRGENGRTGSGG